MSKLFSLMLESHGQVYNNGFLNKSWFIPNYLFTFVLHFAI